MGDASVRNLLITQRYHDLSRCLRETIGGDDANWSTFATWASKTAGDSIRGDRARVVRELVERGTRHEQHDLLAAAVRRLLPSFVIERSSSATRPAPPWRTSAPRSPRAIARSSPSSRRSLPTSAFCAAGGGGRRRRLRAVPGRAATGPGRARGPGRAAAGLMAYRAACARQPRPASAADADGKPLIGFHEQARLQPWIRARWPRRSPTRRRRPARRCPRRAAPRARGVRARARRRDRGLRRRPRARVVRDRRPYFMSLALPGRQTARAGCGHPAPARRCDFPALLLTIGSPEDGRPDGPFLLLYRGMRHGQPRHVGRRSATA